METLQMRNCCRVLALVSVICIVFFQGVVCEVQVSTLETPIISGNIARLEVSRGDNVHPTPGKDTTHVQKVVYPTMFIESTKTPVSMQDRTTQSSGSTTEAESARQQETQAPQHDPSSRPESKPSTSHMGPVVCVPEPAVRGKDAVKLKLMNSSSCEENRAKIESVLEHLCVGDERKLEIYQQEGSNEMIISGQCIQGDASGMTEKFNNDNIKDKVGVMEAEPISGKHSRTVLISILVAGLLLAAVLIAAYVLKTHQKQTKGVRLAEESFQVDEQNQGNTLLSVAPLPPQEPFDKPTSNGESPESLPTNGHSATQTPVADTQM
ncbi:uncharacterized protein si:ch211-286o17.1 [Hoplias malabaricus]|uniref:uncharacterized protein si:ch211-286o17.1 n=1 Tax=Hoplias malabaricus TaxID=27720 RepID=UPI0034623051